MMTGLLQGTRAADDLAEDGANRHLVERSFICFEDILKDFFFTNGGKHLAAVFALELANFASCRRTLVYELENLQVKLVDAGSKIFQLRKRFRGRNLVIFGFARHRRSLLVDCVRGFRQSTYQADRRQPGNLNKT